jgi:single-strand DNA-binding protein
MKMNKAILIGRVAKAIELKQTTSGKSVISFTLAVNKDFKNAEGKYDADFINCVAYGQPAEIISRCVSKGDRFGVVGKINTRTYDKQDGSKGYVTEVKVDEFDFLESKKDKPAETFSNTTADDFTEIADDGDLPF